MDCAPRHLIDGCGVALEPRALPHTHRAHAQHAVTGNKDVLDLDGVGPGAAQTHHVPHVLDRVVATRDQEAHEVDGLAVLDDGTADEDPVGDLTTRRPRPGAVDLVPAVDDLAHTHRRVRRRDPHRGVGTPHVFLRLLVEERQVPVVDADDPGHPAGGAARARDSAHGLVEGDGIDLVATPLFGLHQLEEARALEARDRLVGNPTQILGLLRALLDLGQQCVDLLEDLLCGFAAFARHLARSYSLSPASVAGRVTRQT